MTTSSGPSTPAETTPISPSSTIAETEKTKNEPSVPTFGGLRLRKLSEFVDRGVCFSYFGAGGAGKSELAASAADSEFANRMLWVDSEAGIRSIVSSERESKIEWVRLRRWDNMARILQDLKKGTKSHGFNAVTFDNLSEFYDIIIRKIAGATDAPEIQEWGEANRMLLDFIREARDLSAETGMIVQLTCWDVDDKDDKGRIKKQVAFTPGVQKQYPGLLDAVGHISVENDVAMTRKLSFKPGPYTVSKFRKGREEAASKIPFEIYYGLKNMPMVDILNVLKGGGNWPASKYPNPLQQRATARQQATGATSNPSAPNGQPDEESDD